MSPGISSETRVPAYELFTPSKSGQRLHPTYYRGCWHVVSRCFLSGYRPFSSPLTEVYDPKAFIPHAASLRQAFAHCAIFLTAASRRSLGRVSVPVWPIVLSNRLTVVALVGRYPTNQLMVRRLILSPVASLPPPGCPGRGSFGINHPFGRVSPARGYITYVLLTRLPLDPGEPGPRSTCMC